ncbi:MAG: PEGA domain-containing protein [Candidatus Lokiarchaeota archaeon]|nr:PEGA domain-containing protein [Candidatus Lokiarchaeota archaeon]
MVKKVTSSILLFCFTFTLIFSQYSNLFGQMKQESEQPRIAVLPLTDANAAAKQEEFGESIAGMLMTELINGRVFQVIERSEIEQMMNEMAFQISGAVDSKTAKQIGEILGVDILVFGNVSKFGALVETDIRLIDTQSGEALLAEHASSESGVEIRNMVESLARKIEKRYMGRLIEEVNIKSDPTGASVFIDGVIEGETPLIKNLSMGPHKIRIVKNNFDVWEQQVEVTKGGNSINAKLNLSSEFLKQQKRAHDEEIKKEDKGGSKTVLYILGGAALVGGGAAYLLLSQEDEKKNNDATVNIAVKFP